MYHRYEIPRRSKRWKMLGSPAVGMGDEYAERMIELVTDSQDDYELLK